MLVVLETLLSLPSTLDQETSTNINQLHNQAEFHKQHNQSISPISITHSKSSKMHAPFLKVVLSTLALSLVSSSLAAPLDLGAGDLVASDVFVAKSAM